MKTIFTMLSPNPEFFIPPERIKGHYVVCATHANHARPNILCNPISFRLIAYENIRTCP